MIFSVPLIGWCFYNGYSGQTVFDDLYISLYNFFFTSWPLIIKALFDKDFYYKAWENVEDCPQASKLDKKNPKSETDN